MNFTSIEFWVLVTVTILGCSLLKKQSSKLVVIGIASCFFYMWWDLRFLLLLLLYTVIVYVTALKMKAGNKVLCISFVAVSLMILGGLKYYNFFIESVNGITGAGFSTISIILPIGISFYILTAIGYILDVYRGKYTAESNFLKVLVFVCFYPKLMSGPIERGDKFFDKLDKIERLSKDRFLKGIQIIVIGLIKKLVFADRLGVCVDAVFARPEIYSAPALLCAVLSYSIQIYCDFAGYTDIAIGVAYLIGVRLEDNFNLPYCAANPADFWRRWHISLSSWFRDYVYIPLGGNRKGTFCTYRNTLFTMLISGLWHGANWTFVVWGFIHGIAQCLYRMLAGRKKINPYFAMLLNFIFVTIAWTIFRADSLECAWSIFRGILQWQAGVEYIYIFTPIYFLLVIGMELMRFKDNDGHARYPILNLNNNLHLALFTAEVLLLIALAYFGNGAFIYNNF